MFTNSYLDTQFIETHFSKWLAEMPDYIPNIYGSLDILKMFLLHHHSSFLTQILIP